MDQEIAKFVVAYRELVFQLERSTTASEVAAVLYKTTGGNVLPKLVFDTTGALKSFDVLFALAYDLLLNMLKINTTNQIVCNFLTLNLQKLKSATRRPTVPWPFEIPATVENARQLAMRAHVRSNCVYFDDAGVPRTTAAAIMQNYVSS